VSKKEGSLNFKINQINFTVGDLDGNYDKIKTEYNNSQNKDLDLIIFSELSLSGYPPEDLLQKEYFIKEIESKINDLCKITKNKHTAIIIGAPLFFLSRFEEKFLHNCALLIEDGEVKKIAEKNNIPNQGIFDEKRYFKAGNNLKIINFRDFNIAMLICADIWSKKNAFLLQNKNLDAVIVINASPFSANKIKQRHDIAMEFVNLLKTPLIYVNQVGGQDGVVFDGSSFVLDKNGNKIIQLAEFSQDSQIFNINHDGLINNQEEAVKTVIDINQKLHRVYNCCILGIRDYLEKNGFQKIIIGMSGGIDSALCAAMAVDAIGSKNVKLMALPSKFNSKTSFDDAISCGKNLGIKLESIEINNIFSSFNNALSQQFSGKENDLTEENLQSRIRGNILMALSNKLGHLLLSTGNKSEMAVGYATIYGDMCGSLNPLKDIYKSDIFELVKWRNSNIPNISIYKKKNIIPQNIITKEPTAELRDNQKDSDSLPEYEILDKILFHIIEEEKSIDDIINLGFATKIVKEVANLFYKSEYKRKQSVIGIKISEMSFDKDRRYQITNKFWR
jgi:NAD+ synthase